MFFCADPTSVVYNGRIYVYGTCDHRQNREKSDSQNTYELIKSFVILSTDDMANWKYEGEIKTDVVYTSNTDDNEKTTVRFNGFNFYYKPIDITDSTAPFPNGLPTTSLWQEWHNSQKKEPDLTKSFSKVTYIAGDIEASEVRNYNKNNSYLDWSNMNVDGTSKYIDNEGVIQRNNGINVYKLGCGPANENEKLANGDTNPLYQPGCNK